MKHKRDPVALTAHGEMVRKVIAAAEARAEKRALKWAAWVCMSMRRQFAGYSPGLVAASERILAGPRRRGTAPKKGVRYG